MDFDEPWNSTVVVCSIQNFTKAGFKDGTWSSQREDVSFQVYFPHLRFLLSHPNCLGLTGGKPNHSLYSIGCYGHVRSAILSRA